MQQLILLQTIIDRIKADPVKYLIILIAVLIVLIIVRTIFSTIMRTIRRSRPARIHPKLEKYNVDYAELSRQRQEQAAGIIATSTGNRLHGYRVVRQVEAVFVDGCRTPEEAMTALKASAAQRGANAILNVRTERSSVGKCSAGGDAVVAAPVLQRPQRSQ